LIFVDSRHDETYKHNDVEVGCVDVLDLLLVEVEIALNDGVEVELLLTHVGL
jgi:hypothetical protein